MEADDPRKVWKSGEHASNDQRTVLDCVRERRPPFSPADVMAEFAATLEAYGITRVSGDRYAGEWPRERFHEHGIDYETAESRSRSCTSSCSR